MPRRAVRRRVAHRPGSHAALIEAWLQRTITRTRGTPSSFALSATTTLGFRVTRFDISRALHNINVVRKTYSLIPGMSVPRERAVYLLSMNMLASRADQVLFTDEKKFKAEEFHERFSSSGYAPPGVRLAPGFAPFTASFSSSFLFLTLCTAHVFSLFLGCFLCKASQSLIELRSSEPLVLFVLHLCWEPPLFKETLAWSPTRRSHHT